MSNQETTVIPEDVELPTLDDPKTLKALLHAQAIGVANRLSEASHKNVKREEVVLADQKSAALMAATLSGKNPSYQKTQINTPEKIERNLRNALTEKILQCGIKEEELKDSAVFMQFACYLFTNEVHELINRLTKQPETIDADGATLLQNLLDRWCAMMEAQ